jgi:molybdate transport system permease protein
MLLVWIVGTFLYQYFAAAGSFREIMAAWSDTRILSAVWLSVLSSFATLGVAVLFGVPLAYVFATGEFRGKSLLETLAIDVPQTFPPIAEGMIYFLLLGPSSPFSVNLAFTFSALVIAKTYVSAPFIVSVVARRFQEIQQTGVHMTARSLGASSWQVLTMILLPMSRKDIAAGMALCWARAMGELGGSLVFAGAIAYKTETVTTYIALQSQSLTLPSLAATILVTTVSMVALVLFKVIMKRRFHGRASD